MIVVADTSPLNYLILIDQIELLPALYKSVLIPPAVLKEMQHPSTPGVVRAWMTNPPIWLTIQSPACILNDLPPALDSGEQEAIRLAYDVRPSFLIMDEALGRKTAVGLGLPVVGILGVLKEASQRGLLDLGAALGRLRTTSFHATPALLRRIQQ